MLMMTKITPQQIRRMSDDEKQFEGGFETFKLNM